MTLRAALLAALLALTPAGLPAGPWQARLRRRGRRADGDGRGRRAVTSDVVLRLGGLIYGFGLLVLGTVILVTVWRVWPTAVALWREMSDAVRENSAARRGPLTEERLARIERQMAEVHARVCGGP